MDQGENLQFLKLLSNFNVSFTNHLTNMKLKSLNYHSTKCVYEPKKVPKSLRRRLELQFGLNLLWFEASLMVVAVTRKPGNEWWYYDFLSCTIMLFYWIHSQMLVWWSICMNISVITFYMPKYDYMCLCMYVLMNMGLCIDVWLYVSMYICVIMSFRLCI